MTILGRAGTKQCEILDRYLTKDSARHGFQKCIWTVDWDRSAAMWTKDLDSPRDKVWHAHGPKNLGMSTGWSCDTCLFLYARERTIT